MPRFNVLVTGASGSIGGVAVRVLAQHGDADVVGLLRNPRDGHALPDGVGVRYGDYRAPDTLRNAFVGVDTLLFVSSDGPAAQVLLHHRNVVDAAVDAGVEHIVYLSSLDADFGSPFCYSVTNAATERFIAEAGIASTIVRASIYAEFLFRLFRTATDGSEVQLPAGDGRMSLVTHHDVAHALAAATRRRPVGRQYVITGPEALDMSTVAERWKLASDKPLRYVDITPRQHRIAMAQDGTEPWWAYAYDTMFASIREHRWEAVSQDVEGLTGHQPRHIWSIDVPAPEEYVRPRGAH